MKTSFKLFNFVGAPVELSLWFFLLPLLLPSISMVIAVFISVLVHEMAHAWMANKLGWRVNCIKIDLFTGSAHIDPNIHERDSIPVVAAGPLSNLCLASIVFLLTFIGSYLSISINPLLSQFLINMIVVNVILFIFNILPIYPMDGGRLVKDTLTLKLSSRRTAKITAGWISLITSILLLIYTFCKFRSCFELCNCLCWNL